MSGSIPGIYVAVRGDFNELSKDLKQAKQLVTEQAKEMSNALNNALTPGQTSSGVKGLITNLSTLTQASKVTSANFKNLGVDLGELRKHTSLTAAEFQKLQQQILKTSSTRAQERAFGNIVKSAGLSSVEIQKLGKQFNLSDEQIKKFITSSDKAGKSTESLAFKMKTMIATVVLYSTAFQAVSSVISAVGREFKLGFTSIEEFNLGIAKSAAYMTTFSKKASMGDLAGAYKDAAAYAKPLAEALEMIDNRTIASGKNLQDMSETFLKFGVALDVTNKKQVDGFTNIATALALVTAGQNQEIQIRQEINALMNGQVRATDQLPRLLQRIDPELEKHIVLWKKEGTLIENLGKLLNGFSANTNDLNNLWVTVGSTMETINKRVLRGAFEPAYKDLIELAKELNNSLMDAEGNLTPLAEGIQKTIRDGYQKGKDILDKYGESIVKVGGFLITVKAAQIALNAVISANPYVLAASGIIFMLQHLGLLDDALKKVTESYKNFAKVGTPESTDRLTELFKQKKLEAQNGINISNDRINQLKKERTEIENQAVLTTGLSNAERNRIAAINDEIKALKNKNAVVIDNSKLAANEAAKGDNAKYVVQPPKPKPVVPELVPGKDEDITGNSLASDMNAATNAQVEYLKSVEEKKLEILKAANALTQESNQQAYDNGLESYKTYLTKKLNITVSELRAELSAKEKELSDAQTAAQNLAPVTDKQGNARPDKDRKAEFDALKKVESAEKAVIEARNKLDLAQTSGSQELFRANKDTVDSYKEIQIQLMETQGQVVEAARAQAELDSQSIERLRLIAAADAEEAGAKEALQNIRKQTSITIRNAELEVVSRSKEAQLSIADINGEYQKSIDLQLELVRIEIERAKLAGASPQEINLLKRQAEEIEKMKTPMGALSKGLKDYAVEYGDTNANLLEAAQQTASGMQTAFQDFFFDSMKGELKSLGDYILSFLNSVEEALAQVLSNQVTSSLVSLISGIGTSMIGGGSSSVPSLSTGNTSYGAYSATLSAQGNAFAGETGLSSYRNRIVSTPTTFKFANGLMGESGSSVGEGILPLKRMASGNVGVESSGSINNINIYGEGSATKTEKPNSTGGMDIDVVFDSLMAKNINRSGSATNRAMMTNTGASKPLIRR